MTVPWSHIVSLFLWRSPTAVLWRIIAVSVDSIKAFAFKSWSHISKEVLERINPALAYGYASSAIVWIFYMALATASPFHGTPRTVRSGFFSSVGSLSMDGKSFAAEFPVETSARFGNALSQVFSRNPSDIPAITLALPECFGPAFKMAMRSYDYPSSEALSFQINQRSHT